MESFQVQADSQLCLFLMQEWLSNDNDDHGSVTEAEGFYLGVYGIYIASIVVVMIGWSWYGSGRW